MNDDEAQKIKNTAGDPGESTIKSYELESTYKLRDSINNLTESIDKISKRTEKLQIWLIIWTAVMAVGVIAAIFL